MIVSKIIKITQSRELSRKIVKCSRETDIIYDMTIMMKLTHPRITQFDVNNLITGWRREFGLTNSVRMHEAASKQAFQAVVKFRKANRLKHNKRIWRKKQIKLGKKKTYRHNRWTEPSGLMRRGRKTTRLRSLNSRGKPKLRDDGTVFLPGLGEVRPRVKIPEGRLVSFQMIDVTKKVTRRTKDSDCEFRLCLQIEVPDPEPVTDGDGDSCKAGLDLGVRHLAAVADEHGNEKLYNVPGGCKRHDGDRIDQLKSLRSRCQTGSRRWKEIGRKIAHELKNISNRQKHNEIDIARRITKGLSALFLEDMDLTKMRRSNGAASKTGLNREMAYSRIGEFRCQLEWQMKKKGGVAKRVKYRYTSQKCAACQIVDKKSRNGESFVCVSCGWCHHADKNAAKNILDNDCLHTEETGGQAHGNRGGTIAGVEVVTRREDHGSDGSGMNDSTSRLGPGNKEDDVGRSDRAPERASGHATERSVCTNFRSPLYYLNAPDRTIASRSWTGACLISRT